jgi:hypothetical protein
MAATLVSAALTRAPTTRLAAARRPRTARAAAPRRSARAVPRTVVARARRDFHVPDRLVSLDAPGSSAPGRALGAGTARYRVTFYTGEKMGSGISAPDAGVQIMLIAEDGRAFMHRLDRYPDLPADTNVGKPPSRYSYPRFERGGADECFFDAPDIGVPVAIWVAPEQGGDWFLEEVEVMVETVDERALLEFPDEPPKYVASHGAAPVSFPCGENVRDAVELRPSAFVKLTPEQRMEMRAEGLREYGALKVRMLAVTGAAVVLGCGVTAAMSRGSDLEAMRAFASGGGVGLVYLWMLTRNVDALGAGVDVQKGGERTEKDGIGSDDKGASLALLNVFLNVLVRGASSSPVRIALLAYCGVAGARFLGLDDGIDAFGNPAAPHYGDALAAVLGFFSYKAGVLVAGFSGTDIMNPAPPPDQPAYVRVEETRGVDGREGRERW